MIYSHGFEPPGSSLFPKPDLHARILIIFSILNIFGWLLCTTFEAMILIKFNFPNSLIRFNSLDLISPGIWGSLFYGISGILGICAAYERRHALLVATLVMSGLSIFSSLGIAAVSGMMAISTRFRSQHFQIWLGLEWSLLIVTILSFMVNVTVFVTVSIVTCKPCRRRAQNRSTRIDLNRNINDRSPMPFLPPPPPPGFMLNPPPIRYPGYSSTPAVNGSTSESNL